MVIFQNLNLFPYNNLKIGREEFLCGEGAPHPNFPLNLFSFIIIFDLSGRLRPMIQEGSPANGATWAACLRPADSVNYHTQRVVWVGVDLLLEFLEKIGGEGL